ncbi:helix-turn-helix domain-containing protein [Paenibacillus sp. GCM10027627]|uniref:helix-turn-helix domain-containing protein n=1 Tax=unclassified Paenibacillus TaxID=185978 RepID=UPI003631E1B9
MKNIEAYRIIEDTVNLIEEKLKKNLSLDDLSSSLNVSKFHLHRLMRHATGMPLIEYIRARRLSKSIDLLMNTRMKIIDISLEFGFDHEQSYIRSFKKQFGVTPSCLRKQFQPIKLMEKFDLSRLLNVADGLLFEPVFVMRPSCKLVGRRYEVNIEENYHEFTSNTVGVDFFYTVQPHIPYKVNPNLYIGLTLLILDEYSTVYFPSTEVYSFSDDIAPENTFVLPAQKYIVFKYIGHFHPRRLTIRQLEEIWNFIGNWMPKSPYSYAASHYFEYIDITVATETYCEVDLHIPYTD